VRALEDVHWARSAYLNLNVEGVPGVRTVSVYAWPEPAGRPTRIGIDVVREGSRALAHPVSINLDLSPEERPAATTDPGEDIRVTAEDLADMDDDRPAEITLSDGRTWQFFSRGIQREAHDLDRQGRPIYREVDTSMYCYRMICNKCGRPRYAKRNSIHQIQYCRICTRAARLRKRAIDQCQERSAKGQGPWQRLAPHQVDEALELDAEGHTVTSIAEKFGFTVSGMSRLLRRHRGRPKS
jgi:hypothetical protein